MFRHMLGLPCEVLIYGRLGGGQTVYNMDVRSIMVSACLVPTKAQELAVNHIPLETEDEAVKKFFLVLPVDPARLCRGIKRTGDPDCCVAYRSHQWGGEQRVDRREKQPSLRSYRPRNRREAYPSGSCRTSASSKRNAAVPPPRGPIASGRRPQTASRTAGQSCGSLSEGVIHGGLRVPQNAASLPTWAELASNRLSCSEEINVLQKITIRLSKTALPT